LAVVVVGAVFMTTNNNKNKNSKDTTSSLKVPVDIESDVEEMVVEEVGEAREILVKGNEFKFSPASISVEKGENIRLVFENIGTSSHNFKIEGLGISTATIPGGETDTVNFVAEESGTYNFYCGVGNHRALGMEGELVAN